MTHDIDSRWFSSPTKNSPQSRRTSSRRLRFENLEGRELLAVILDSDFGNGGIVQTAFNFDVTASDMVVQKDGKVVVGGLLSEGGTTALAVARYEPSGYLDPTFGFGGTAVADSMSPAADEVQVALQSDGKIIVVGTSVGIASGTDDFMVVRLNRNGTFDNSFGAAGVVYVPIGTTGDFAKSVAVQANGKIVVTGFSDVSGGGFELSIARLNANGSLDTSFGGTGKMITKVGPVNSFGGEVLVQPDGKIVVGGTAFSNQGLQSFAAVRYNVNGSLDTSFSGDGMQIVSVGAIRSGGRTLAIQTDGAIVLGGFKVVSGINISDAALVRLRPNGTLDPTFSTDGQVSVDFAGSDFDFLNHLAIQADGKIIAAGGSDFAGGRQATLFRFNANGNLDRTFDGDGKRNVPFEGESVFSNVHVYADGRILAASQRSSSGPQVFELARFRETKPEITSFIVPNRAALNQRVNLSAFATDRNQAGATLLYTWTITGPRGFKATLKGRNVSFVASQRGTLSVSLVVTDREGLTALVTDKIAVV